MLSLSDAAAGSDCRIIWMLGEYVEAMKAQFNIRENSSLFILQNQGGSVCFKTPEGRKVGVSPEISRGIKIVYN